MKTRMLLLIMILFVQVAFSAIPPQKRSREKKDLPKADSIFPVTHKLLFEGKAIRGSIRKSEIDSLLDLRVDMEGSGNDDRYGIELTDANGNEYNVFTCREWARELSKGSYADTTFDMTMEALFIRPCCFLFALKDAQPAKKSFIAKPKLGLSNLNLIPEQVLSDIWAEEEAAEKRKTSRRTISQLVAKKEIKADRKRKDRLWLSDGSMDTYLTEIGRADFDVDGTEDIFVFTSEYATSGSLRIYGHLLLTKPSRSSIFQIKYQDLSAFDEKQVEEVKESDLKSNQLISSEITSQQYGDVWPFSVKEGILSCIKINSVAIFLTAEGKTYALNGWARDRKIDGKDVSLDVDEIRVFNDAHSLYPNKKKLLNPVLNKGFAMCGGK